jgi:hypothetical protein
MEYKYPEQLTKEELSVVLRKVLDNLKQLQQLYTKFYSEEEYEKALETKKAIDLHYVALNKFLTEHQMDEVQ